MQYQTLTIERDIPLHVHAWLPETAPRGIIHIAHGMAEHGARFGRLAEALTSAGFAVYANDHRGHGETVTSEDDLGWFGEDSGWEIVLDDLRVHIEEARKRHPGLPVVLFGQSMGSLLTQDIIWQHPDLVSAAVLVSTSGPPSPLGKAGRIIARLERVRGGKRCRSAVIDSMTFQSFNKAFAPTRTGFDWLSRDPDEVDKYVADPKCGFVLPVGSWIGLLDNLGVFTSVEAHRKIRQDLPIYVISGDRDPVGENGAGVRALLANYDKAGLTAVSSKLYPDARHELFNETNRDEVTDDLLTWLESVID